MVATKELPTLPLEPTRYPSSTDFHTNFCAMMYITAKPLVMMEWSSFFSLASTISGNSGP